MDRLKRNIIITKDGSNSLYIPSLDETYHSRHGAIREAKHVFIKQGLDKICDDNPINILEVGFGTGLNAWITYIEHKKRNVVINYTGIDKYPIEEREWKQLNYYEEIKPLRYKTAYNQVFYAKWNKKESINSGFTLQKVSDDILRYPYPKNHFHLIYFDAFSPRVQPYLWTTPVFLSMHQALKKYGRLVTYSSKGSVKRAMIGAGFMVEKLPGPPGKREMIAAHK